MSNSNNFSINNKAIEMNKHKLDFDLQSVVSMEILESDSFVEARNEEVNIIIS